MAATQNRAEITSADTKQLGFEYQYLYFIIKLLQMRYGDEVGYEARDDIHVVSASSCDTLYIQVKHTTDLTADGSPANLTNLSGVIPSERERGIGRQMVVNGIDWLKSQNCTSIELRYVEIVNWYRKIGFKATRLQWIGEKNIVQ